MISLGYQLALEDILTVTSNIKYYKKENSETRRESQRCSPKAPLLIIPLGFSSHQIFFTPFFSFSKYIILATGLLLLSIYFLYASLEFGVLLISVYTHSHLTHTFFIYFSDLSLYSSSLREKS